MNKSLALLLLAGLALPASAQKMKMTSGSFAAVKGESSVDLRFTYDNMTVGKKSEADYLADKMADYNEKEPGRGDNFAKSWVADRGGRFEPKFEELFNDGGPLKGSRNNSAAKYGFVINTDFTEPGYNIGISKMPAFINATVKLVDKASGQELGSMTVTNVPGSQFGGYDFDTGTRLSESYAKLGKELRQWLEKNVFKK